MVIFHSCFYGLKNMCTAHPSIVSACDSGRLTVFLSFSGPTGIPSAYDIPSPWRNVFQDEPRSKGDRVSPKLHFLGSVDVRMKGLVAGQRLQRDSFCLGWKQCILMSFPGWWVWLPWAIPPIHGHFDGTMMLNQWLEWAFPIVQSDKAITIMENLRRPFHLHFPVSKKKKATRKHLQSRIISCLIILKASSRLSPSQPESPTFSSSPCSAELFENQLGPAFGHRERPVAIRHRYGGDVAVDIAMVGMIADQRWTKKKLEKNKNPSIIHHPNIPLCHTMPSFFEWNHPIFLIPIPQNLNLLRFPATPSTSKVRS